MKERGNLLVKLMLENSCRIPICRSVINFLYVGDIRLILQCQRITWIWISIIVMYRQDNYAVSQKTGKIIFVITTLNFHQIRQFFAQW